MSSGITVVLALLLALALAHANEEQEQCFYPVDCPPDQFCAYYHQCVPSYCNAQGTCDLPNFTCDGSSTQTCLPPHCEGGNCPPSFICSPARLCTPSLNFCQPQVPCANVNFWCLDAACIPIVCQNQSDCTRFNTNTQCANGICQLFDCTKSSTFFPACPNASFFCNPLTGLCQRNATVAPTQQPTTGAPTGQPTSRAPTPQPAPISAEQGATSSYIFLGVYLPVILIFIVVWLLYRRFAPKTPVSRVDKRSV